MYIRYNQPCMQFRHHWENLKNYCSSEITIYNYMCVYRQTGLVSSQLGLTSAG